MALTDIQSPTLDLLPTPWDLKDAVRWDTTRLKRRILYNKHAPDVKALLKRVVGTVREEAWKALDLSSNVAVDAYTTRAVVYAEPPHLGADPGLVARVGKSGLWELMRRVQRDSLGLRVVFVRPNVVGGRLAYRVVWPDMTVVETDGDDTSRPVQLWEARRFKNPVSGAREWLWEHFDVSDPDHPAWRIIERNGDSDEIDRTGDFLGELAGTFPAMYREGGVEGGRPFMPHEPLRAERAPDFWDEEASSPVFEGTLWVAAGYAFYQHVMRSSSWQQKYGVNVQPLGAEQRDENEDGEARDRVVTDPATVQLFSAIDPEMQPMLGQFAVAADPQHILAAVQGYERAVLGRAGLNPADIHRVSGDPRSGYALALTRDGQRDSQRKEAPTNRRFVEGLMMKSASLCNAELDESYGTDATVRFTAIRPSVTEQRAEAEHLNAEVDAGHLDVVSAHQRRNPGMTRREAEEDLVRIRRVNAQFK